MKYFISSANGHVSAAMDTIAAAQSAVIGRTCEQGTLILSFAPMGKPILWSEAWQAVEDGVTVYARVGDTPILTIGTRIYVDHRTIGANVRVG